MTSPNPCSQCSRTVLPSIGSPPSQSGWAKSRLSMMFARFFSLLKKHHMLALLSALRLHKVQTMINLRQVLEAGINAGQVPLAAGGGGGEAGGGRRLGQMTAL